MINTELYVTSRIEQLQMQHVWTDIPDFTIDSKETFIVNQLYNGLTRNITL